MTFQTLSARDRMTLTIGVITIASLCIASWGLPAWVRWERRVREDAVTTATEAAESRRSVRSAPSLARLTRHLERQYAALAPALLSGERPLVAGASLISHVNEAAADAGVQLGALQVETDSSNNRGPLIVSVHGDGSGDVSGVMRFLAAIEGGVPLLSVRALSITAGDVRASGATAETLHMDFVIDGLARPDRDDPDAHADSGRTVSERAK